MNNILIPRNLEGRIEQKKQIDLKRIQEYIKKGSEGDLFLEGTPLTKLPDNLIRVGGNLNLKHAHFNKLPDNLIKVDGTLNIMESNIEDLNNLEYVEGSLWANNIKIKSLPPKLTRITGSLSLSGCPIDNIDNVKYVGGGLFIDRTNVSELPEGLRVGGALYCKNTPLSKRFPDKSLFLEYLVERNIKVGRGIYF